METKRFKIEDVILDISMGPFGSDIKKEVYTDSGVPVLNGSNLQGFELVEDSFGYVTEEKADSLKKANAHRGDIVITHRGTIGQIVYIPQNSKFERYVISQSQFRVTCNKDIVLPEYLTYYFHTREGQYKLLSNASQVGVPALARASTTFRKLEIDLPSIEIQRKAIDIILELQQKIAVNRRICANLEAQAQALFKHWFIDFAPFKDGKFVESELGMIPEGWRVNTIDDFCRVFTGKKNTNQAENNGKYPFFSCAPNPLKSNDYLYDGYAIIIAGNGSYTGRTQLYNGKFDLYQRTYACVAKERSFDKKIVFFYLVMKQTFEREKMGGTRGSSIPFIVMNDIAKQYFCYNEYVVTEFCNIVRPILDMTQALRIESSRLSSLRDTLLPKLMSGEIKV